MKISLIFLCVFCGFLVTLCLKILLQKNEDLTWNTIEFVPYLFIKYFHFKNKNLLEYFENFT